MLVQITIVATENENILFKIVPFCCKELLFINFPALAVSFCKKNVTKILNIILRSFVSKNTV